VLLSKTNFLIYSDRAHYAWLKMHDPELYGATLPSAFEQSIMETGYDVAQEYLAGFGAEPLV